MAAPGGRGRATRARGEQLAYSGAPLGGPRYVLLKGKIVNTTARAICIPTDGGMINHMQAS